MADYDDADYIRDRDILEVYLSDIARHTKQARNRGGKNSAVKYGQSFGKRSGFSTYGLFDPTFSGGISD